MVRLNRPLQRLPLLSAFLLLHLLISPSLGNAAPTYNKDVAPILIRHCAVCHRPGQIAAAVPLLAYDTARPWAQAIKQAVLLRDMPPWPADPAASLKFRNDARLSRQDIESLVAWVDAGAPQGKDRDISPMPKFADGWLYPGGRKPDLVISMPGAFQLPAKGEIPYVGFLAKLPFLGDKWIEASQAQPSDPAVVHHMAITEVVREIPSPDGNPVALLARQLGVPNPIPTTRPAVTAPGDSSVFDMLGVYVPGSTLEMYGSDSGKLLRGGTNMYLNFNVHYTTIGKPAKDRSSIAFWFRTSPPKHQIFRVPAAAGTILVQGTELLTDTPGTKAEGTHVVIPPIPPNEPNYQIIGITPFTEPVTIFQFQPHAHMRAKDFQYAVVYPDGREESVLSIPKYSFNWQLAYQLETPLQLPAGSKLIVTAHYDNSRNNRGNPAPEKEVYFKDQNQSWDEMFTPFVQYSIDARDSTRSPEDGPSGLPITELVGCLEQGLNLFWSLSKASDPALSRTPSTTSFAVKRAEATPLAHGQYRLLGVGVFHPARDRGRKVVVKGVLIKDPAEDRLNVTSLQPAGGACPN